MLLKLVMGLMLLIGIVAAASRLIPPRTAAATATPQHAYLRLQDELIAKP